MKNRKFMITNINIILAQKIEKTKKLLCIVSFFRIFGTSENRFCLLAGKGWSKNKKENLKKLFFAVSFRFLDFFPCFLKFKKKYKNREKSVDLIATSVNYGNSFKNVF